jgi:hypothetical protein
VRSGAGVRSAVAAARDLAGRAEALALRLGSGPVVDALAAAPHFLVDSVS